MNLDEFNLFTISEQNSIPPISKMWEPEKVSSMGEDEAKVEIYPIFGLPYHSIVPKNEILPLLTELNEFNKYIDKAHEATQDEYYKKLEIPIIGRLVAAPIAKKGDAKLLEMEFKSREIHNKIESVVYLYMTPDQKEEMIESRNWEHERFNRYLRALGYDVP